MIDVDPAPGLGVPDTVEALGAPFIAEAEVRDAFLVPDTGQDLHGILMDLPARREDQEGSLDHQVREDWGVRVCVCVSSVYLFG